MRSGGPSDVGGVKATTFQKVFFSGFGLALLFTVLEFLYEVPPLGPWLHASTSNVILFLILLDVPLWAAQVGLWGRGESYFEAFLPKLNRTVTALDDLATLMEEMHPAVVAIREVRETLTPDEIEIRQACMYGGVKADLLKIIPRILEGEEHQIGKWREEWRVAKQRAELLSTETPSIS